MGRLGIVRLRDSACRSRGGVRRRVSAPVDNGDRDHSIGHLGPGLRVRGRRCPFDDGAFVGIRLAQRRVRLGDGADG